MELSEQNSKKCELINCCLFKSSSYDGADDIITIYNCMACGTFEITILKNVLQNCPLDKWNKYAKLIELMGFITNIQNILTEEFFNEYSIDVTNRNRSKIIDNIKLLLEQLSEQIINKLGDEK